MLQVGRREVGLGRTGQTVVVDGPLLTLRNEDETFELRGSPPHLEALAARLRQFEGTGSSESVPVALQGVRGSAVSD